MRIILLISSILLSVSSFAQVQFFDHGKVNIPSADIFFQKVQVDNQLVIPNTKDTISYGRKVGSISYVNDSFFAMNSAFHWVQISGSGGISQIYNYFGTNIHGGDSVGVDTTLIQTKLPYTPENTANKVGSGASPNSTTYYTTSAINTLNNLIYTAIADSVLGRVKYIDSLTVYATPKNVKDSANSVRSAIPDAYTKTISDGRYFKRADSNTAQNPVTLYYFNTHSTPTQTTTITGDVAGVGVGTVNVTLASVGTAGTPGDATHVGVTTYNSKGLETGWTNILITPDWPNITNRPTTAEAYSITNVYNKTTSDARYLQTAVTSVTAGSGLNGGTITGIGTISLPTYGTAGTYGSSSLMTIVTTNAFGQCSVTTTPVAAVTSFSVTVPADMAVSGSPITSTGTIAITHSAIFTITDGAAFVFNGNNGNIQKVTLGAARTFTITNLVVGIIYNFWVTHGTSTTLTWGTAVKSEWNTAGVPPQSTPNGAVDLYVLRYDGTNINVETHLNLN